MGFSENLHLFCAFSWLMLIYIKVRERFLITHSHRSILAKPSSTQFIFRPNPTYSIAIGKAATAMAIGLEEALGEKLVAGDHTRWIHRESKALAKFTADIRYQIERA